MTNSNLLLIENVLVANDLIYLIKLLGVTVVPGLVVYSSSRLNKLGIV